MNIDEIKRRLNNKTILNNPQAPQEPKQKNDVYLTKKSETPKIIRPPERLTKKDLVNDLYDDDTDEDEEKPESQVWETEKETIDINQPVKNIIETLELDDKKYDWRYKTRKGKQSRHNFTNFMVIAL